MLKSRFLRYKAWQTEFYITLNNFLHFHLTDNMKKMLRDIIILHLCTTNGNHIMYGSWDMEHGRQNYLVLLGHFLPIYTLKNNPDNQNFEKMKKAPGDITILHKCTKYDVYDIISYDVWFLRYEARLTKFFVILGLFLTF